MGFYEAGEECLAEKTVCLCFLDLPTPREPRLAYTPETGRLHERLVAYGVKTGSNLWLGKTII